MQHQAGPQELPLVQGRGQQRLQPQGLEEHMRTSWQRYESCIEIKKARLVVALEPLELWRDILLCERERVHIGIPWSYPVDPIFSAELYSCGIYRNHPRDLLQTQKILLTESPLCKANARRY